MINHAYTLLLNRAGGYREAPLELYVPNDFRSVAPLPEEIGSVRRILFGTSPDDTLLHYRARQFLPLLHSADLEAFVLALDPRVTYDPRVGPEDFGMSSFGIRVVPQAEASPSLWVLGQSVRPDETGICFREWRVVILSANEISVTRTIPPPVLETVTFYVLADGVGGPIDLQDAPLRFLFSAAPPGTAWTIRSVTPPSANLGDLVRRIQALPEATLAKVFRRTDQQGGLEPWRTFYALWTEHPETPVRLGALLLGLIYRMEDLRQKREG